MPAFPMELASERETKTLGFPTATPVLDVLRPWPNQDPGRMTTGDYFFISSAIILGFTELPVLRQFLDSLSRGTPLVFWMGVLGLPLIALLAAALVHMAGHLLAGRLAGFEAVKLRLGGFTLLDRLESSDVLSLGFAVVRPHGNERLRLRLTCLILGGPVASLCAPVLLEAVWRLARDYAGGSWLLLTAAVHLFAALSLLTAIGSLLPDIDSRGNFSDGTRLLMLLKNDVRGWRVLAMLELQLRLRSGEHPRGWGEDLVARAVAQPDESFDTVAANWLAYLWASGRQDLSQATKFLETALATVGSSPGHLRERILLEAAIFQAWFRHNFAKAKFWESQIAHLHSLPVLDRKRLDIASCWSEGKSFHAWEKLVEYLRWLHALPALPNIALAERDALDWKGQMESRLLSGAWATMHSWPYQRHVM